MSINYFIENIWNDLYKLGGQKVMEPKSNGQKVMVSLILSIKPLMINIYVILKYIFPIKWLLIGWNRLIFPF